MVDGDVYIVGYTRSFGHVPGSPCAFLAYSELPCYRGGVEAGVSLLYVEVWDVVIGPFHLVLGVLEDSIYGFPVRHSLTLGLPKLKAVFAVEAFLNLLLLLLVGVSELDAWLLGSHRPV